MSAKTPFPPFGPNGECGATWPDQLKPVGVSKSLHYLLASGKPPRLTDLKSNFSQGLARNLDYPEAYHTPVAYKKHVNAVIEEYNREGLPRRTILFAVIIVLDQTVSLCTKVVNGQGASSASMATVTFQLKLWKFTTSDWAVSPCANRPPAGPSTLSTSRFSHSS